jgi:hypothetical protein
MAAVYLTISLLAVGWARETLSSTLLNRRLAWTLVLHACAQVLLGGAAWLAGFTPQQGQLLLLFCWGLSQTFLAVWAERWFAVPAASSALSFVLAARWPELRYLLMSLANLVFSVVVVRVWFPRQLITLMLERRAAIRQRARERRDLGEQRDAR